MSRSIGLSPAVESYMRAMNRDEHPAMARCREETYAEAETPQMQISPEQAALMTFFARLLRSRTYVEVGVFTGYSALAMALAMKDMHGDTARVIACDISEDFMDKARGYWRDANVDDIIETRIGPAEESLRTLPDASAEMMFVDADKAGYPAYLEHSARLLRAGGVALFDNVLWSGSVADAEKTDADTAALRRTAELAKEDERFDIAFTAVGDGLLLCRKRE